MGNKIYRDKIIPKVNDLKSKFVVKNVVHSCFCDFQTRRVMCRRNISRSMSMDVRPQRMSFKREKPESNESPTQQSSKRNSPRDGSTPVQEQKRRRPSSVVESPTTVSILLQNLFQLVYWYHSYSLIAIFKDCYRYCSDLCYGLTKHFVLFKEYVYLT